MMLLYILIAFLVALFFMNWLLGYKKGNITLTLDNRYSDLKEYANAISEELEQEGKQAVYKGRREFLVDGKLYEFSDRTVPIGGVPTQQTILQPK
jgi:flavorubredoxin